jgi:GT2 family glycosyltransferase
MKVLCIHLSNQYQVGQNGFKIKNEFPTLNPMDQFYKYSKGLTIEKFETQLKLFAPDRPIVLDTPPDFTSSCCMLLERNFLESSGGISDPVFSQYGSEDIDLCWRIGCNGGQIAKLPDVYIHHFHNSSLLANKVDVRLLLRKSNKILYTKWKEYLFELIISKSNSELETTELFREIFHFRSII